MILFFHLLMGLSFASDVGSKTIMRDLSQNTKSFDWKNQKQSSVSTPASVPSFKRQRTTPSIGGNLRSDLIRQQSQANPDIAKAIIIPKMGANLTSLGIGDVLECVIKQDIIGYVGSVSPVRADVVRGDYAGYFFIGNATMDPKTKSIVVEFHSLRSPDGRDVHAVKASVHSVTGELGLVGSHNSYYWRYFFASVLSRAAQGYAEGLVERERNILGQYVNVPGPENAGKIAVAEGAAQTADLFAEQMKQAPEFTRVEGPIETKVFIFESPKVTLRR